MARSGPGSAAIVLSSGVERLAFVSSVITREVEAVSTAFRCAWILHVEMDSSRLEGAFLEMNPSFSEGIRYHYLQAVRGGCRIKCAGARLERARASSTSTGPLTVKLSHCTSLSFSVFVSCCERFREMNNFIAHPFSPIVCGVNEYATLNFRLTK